MPLSEARAKGHILRLVMREKLTAVISGVSFYRTETLFVLVWIKGIEQSKPVFGICFDSEITIK